MEDKPVVKAAPLDDWEVQDVLHRMAFELCTLKGQTVRGETALKAANRSLLLYIAALIAANDPERPPSPP